MSYFDLLERYEDAYGETWEYCCRVPGCERTKRSAVPVDCDQHRVRMRKVAGSRQYFRR